MPLRSRAPRPPPLEISRSPSMDSLCSNPDMITPKEQLFRVEDGPTFMQIDDDPAPPLPHPQKRTRPLPRCSSGSGDDEFYGPVLSRSNSGMELGHGGITMLSGRPPIPKLREMQPPMPRNPYLVRVEDDSHIFQASQSCLNRGGYSRFHWDYLQEAELGSGNSSRVYRAVHRLTGAAYAIKTNRNPITTLQARNMWLNEMQALAAVQPHPNIIGLFDAWFEADARGEQAYIKLELCGENLSSLARSRQGPSREAEVLDMLRQMASALKRIHELGMVHLDIKPDNIYVALPTSSSGNVAAANSSLGPVYKLGDFGLAVLQGGQRVGTSEGDCRYLAPEAFTCRDFLTSGLADRLDIFALGASAYELLRGSELPKNGQLYHDIRAGKIALPGCSQRMISLLMRMMAPEPSHRPSADQLLKCPLFYSRSLNNGGSPPPQVRQSAPLPVVVLPPVPPPLRREHSHPMLPMRLPVNASFPLASTPSSGRKSNGRSQR